jgi:hypothetical protein
MTRISRLALFFALLALTSMANAIQPIPEKPGWSGFVTLGAGSVTSKTNMLAGIPRYGITLGDQKISSLSNEPSSVTSALPQVNLSINYTFSTRTQLFIGNSLENVVQFDTVTIGGVRQQFADKSILEVSAVSTPVLSPVQVWKDPYVVGVNRQATDRTSRGLRIEYDKIAGSGFGVQYTQRRIDINQELSGTTQLGLTPGEAQALSRKGDTKRLVGSYQFRHKNKNVFEVRFGRLQEDLDGKAMSGDQNEVQLTHVYLGERFTLASNLFLAHEDYDEINPVFGKTRKDDNLGLGFVVFDKKIFKSKKWVGQATLVWYNQNSNINFYDASSTIIALGAQYRF